MKFITFLVIFVICNEIMSQTQLTEDSQCDWYNDIINTTDLAQRLALAKANFREYQSIAKDDSCRILYCLSVNDKYYTLSTDSAVYFRFPEKMLEAAILEEIDTIVTLNKEAAKKLYGDYCKGVIVIQSSSIDYEKRIDSILYQKE